MKTIIAILRIDTMNETKQALSDAGVPSLLLPEGFWPG